MNFLYQFSILLAVQTPNLTQGSLGGQQELGMAFLNPENASKNQ